MRIAILSDAGSWKNEAIAEWRKNLVRAGHQVVWLHEAEAVPSGDLLFILGFYRVVPREVLIRNRNNIVVHESALPKGRGWSPLTWQVLEGANRIPLTLFEAVEKVDAGKMYLRSEVALEGHELLPEIREKVAAEMTGLCQEFVSRYPEIIEHGVAQEDKPTYYPRRTAEHCRLDPRISLQDQFDLLRVVDNHAYPAFFTLRGATYVLKIERKEG